MVRRLVLLGVAVVVVVATAVIVISANGGYSVSVLLPTATNLTVGGSVLMDGFPVGAIGGIDVAGNQARLTLNIDGSRAPLHDGAVLTVDWKSLVGERRIDVTDGPKGNATIPSGGMIKGTMPAPMEIDQVLAALDTPTRTKLRSLINELNGTVQGHAQDLNQTLTTAGPALQALGDVLRGLGTDGPAINQLVNELDQMVSTLSQHDSQVRDIVDQLTTLAGATVQERQALDAALQRLPGTVATANKTLGDVPGVADKAVPLLRDLQPAAAQLPAVAANLSPLLVNLRPLAAQLGPTLASAQTLLRYTPGLLDSANATLPQLDNTVANLVQPLDFLRPYSPEIAAAFTNWNSGFAGYNGTGHYVRVMPTVGAHSVEVNPGVMPPGYSAAPTPLPGSLAGQPWTDATGSGVH